MERPRTTQPIPHDDKTYEILRQEIWRERQRADKWKGIADAFAAELVRIYRSPTRRKLDIG